MSFGCHFSLLSKIEQEGIEGGASSGGNGIKDFFRSESQKLVLGVFPPLIDLGQLKSGMRFAISQGKRNLYTMNRKYFLLVLMMAFSFGGVFAQAEAGNARELPTANVKDLDGNTVSTADFDNDGKPIVISFWATWCKPCILELSTILDDYEDLQEETGVKLIAISIDDARNAAKVKPFVNGRDWPYEVYIDSNQDFKRALGVNNVPSTFLLNGNKEIVWQHNSYSPGDEEELYEKVEHLAEEAHSADDGDGVE